MRFFDQIMVSDRPDAIQVHITGLVQGVGFRPFIYRLAIKNQIAGWVKNTTNGVHIQAVGKWDHLNCFVREIPRYAPPVAEISNVEIIPSKTNGEQVFRILTSSESTNEITEVSPDIAICDDCLKDMQTQEHRIHYPLINCTNCGPRFSITKKIPYDRQQTTMSGFPMCDNCSAEYNNINDRRFHAQPVACNHCGPQYSLYSPQGKCINSGNLPAKAAQLIDDGNIIAIKGTGGFHLACDALNTTTVNRLRSSKLREGKPFAVMFPSLKTLGEFAHLNQSEEKLLRSWIRPIVLLRGKNKLAPTVNAGLSSLGAILPYMPFHYLLFKHLKTKAIIFTSGNLSEEPVLIDRHQAILKLGKVFDLLIDYNRDIYNRTDDSVVQAIDNRTQIIRRSRGYAPKPIRMAMNVDGIFATGGELKNCFCIGKGNMAIMSQHIGDLKNLETFSFYDESARRTKDLFRFKTTTIATDLHPDYLTTEWSKKQDKKLEFVQHHHAHIASCLAEHQIDENEDVIGLGFDGTGYGTDGCIWGSEIMLCNLKKFKRLGHFEYLPMPGGDKAVLEPWRMALGCLFKVFGNNIPDSALRFFNNIERANVEIVLTALENNIHITQTSGIGRLFDVVSSLLGLCQYASFEAEGPMQLEASLDHKCRSYYETSIDKNGIILVGPIIEGIINDLTKGTRVGLISARFHNTIIETTAKAIVGYQALHYPKIVVLSGGTFQNRYLLSGMIKKLGVMNMKVLTNQQVPVNDGGIALGQLAVAAARRKSLCV